jgi:outer membrane protein assembly factor BamB
VRLPRVFQLSDVTRWRRLVAAAVLVTAVPTGAAIADPAPPAPIDECDWTSFRNGPTNHGASTCTGIDKTNVRTLAPTFLYRTKDSVTATPAVVDGVLYAGAWDGTVYAFRTAEARGVGDHTIPDEVTVVEPIWETKLDDANDVSFGRIVASPTVVDVDGTRIVLVAGGATLYALDAEGGAVLAERCLDPRDIRDRCGGSEGVEIEVESSPTVVRTGEPGVVDVVIGLDVHNEPGIGRTGVVRLRLFESGTSGWHLEPVWKFDPETGKAYKNHDLLIHGAGDGRGCGGVWGTAAVDVEADIVVFGTGSCRDGSQDGEAVFGVRFSDGAQVWRFAARPGEQTDLDDDFGTAAQLFTIGHDLVAGIGGKDGTYYTFDARTGAAGWSTKVGQPGHVEEGFAIGGILGSPALGVVNGKPALFITTAISVPDETTADDPQRMLSLHAVDATTGDVLWRSPVTRQTYAHPTYANGIVFVASTAGLSVQAFDADTHGAPLWTSPPLNGAPSSGVAVTDTGIYIGAGTRQTDAGYKVTEDDSAVAGLIGADPQERLAGIWGFEVVGS